MTAASVLFTIFINFVELLVAFIQAYVFTLLSAVFIGLARVESHTSSEGSVHPLLITGIRDKNNNITNR